VVEGLGALEADLLLRCEEQLEARMRAPLVHDALRRDEHHGDGGLVVRPEDRARAVVDDSLLDDRLDRTLGRHGVEVGAEEDRRAGAVGRLQSTVEIAGVGADRRARAVLVHREPEVAEEGADDVGGRALGAGRRRQRSQF
jgi:hypothetical protein